MTLNSLKAICAAYHGQNVSACTVGGVDLFLVAANNARRNAEQLHDFQDSSITATLSIDGVTGGALGSAVIAASTTSFIATGVTVPAVAGEYVAIAMYNGKPLYYNEAKGKLLVYVMSTDGSDTPGYVISPAIEDLTTSWIPASPLATPVGTYINLGAGPNVVVTAGELARFSGIKTITAIQRTNVDGSLEPLDFTSSTGAINRVRDQINVAESYYFEQRYPSDRQLYTLGQDGTLIQSNNTIYIYPRPAVAGDPLQVTIEGYGWLREYDSSDLSSTEPTDFFVQYGSSFLQWSIILELNYLFKTFVPRVEGELSPPQQMKDEAWRDLLVWDGWRVDAHSTSTR